MRPRKPKSEKKPSRGIRLTDSLYEKIENAAHDAGMNISEWVARACEEQLKRSSK